MHKDDWADHGKAKVGPCKDTTAYLFTNDALPEAKKILAKDAARENVAELLEGVPAEPSQSIAEFLCKSKTSRRYCVLLIDADPTAVKSARDLVAAAKLKYKPPTTEEDEGISVQLIKISTSTSLLSDISNADNSFFHETHASFERPRLLVVDYDADRVAALDEAALADVFAALESDRLQWRELAARSAVLLFPRDPSSGFLALLIRQARRSPKITLTCCVGAILAYALSNYLPAIDWKFICMLLFISPMISGAYEMITGVLQS